MEVPVINLISDFDVVINDPSLLSRPFAFSGKLHEAYSFWKLSVLLLLAIFASFTSFATRLKSFVVCLTSVDHVPLPSTALAYDYESDSDSSCSSASSSEDENDEEELDQDDEDLRVKRFGYYNDNEEEKGINGNIPWIRRSFGDLLSWPDLGGFGSSGGVVKLWDSLDLNGENGHQKTMASIFGDGGGVISSWLSPAVVLAAEEKKVSDAVEVSAWDARAGFGMPALLAEWTQPGRLLGKIVTVNGGDVDKIYVGDNVTGEITMGDMRMVNGSVTESSVKMVRRRRRH
ncbi:unnamed protein product [Cochlearia groenlandica]